MLWEMVVVLKLSRGQYFLLKVNESHFYLRWIDSFSHEGRSLRFVSFTIYAVNTNWVLSPTESEGPWVNWCCLTCVQLWIRPWFSPTSQTPTSCIIKSLGLSWSDSHTAVYEGCPAPALLSLLFTFGKQLQVFRQRTGFLAICPLQPYHLWWNVKKKTI